MSTQPDLWDEGVAEQHAVIEAVNADWRREHDRWLIDQAMQRVAMRNGGLVYPNQVRRELTNEHGLMVNPRSLSARYGHLASAGVLVWDGVTVEPSDDVRGRNVGTLQKVRRWTGREAA